MTHPAIEAAMKAYLDRAGGVDVDAIWSEPMKAAVLAALRHEHDKPTTSLEGHRFLEWFIAEIEFHE